MKESQAPISASDVPGEEPRRRIHLLIFGYSPAFTLRQWRVFLIAVTGGCFDQYDIALLTLALEQIQKGLRIAQAGIGPMVSFIKLGNVLSFLITPLADVIGRRRLLLYTIVAYTVFTALSAIAPNEAAFVTVQVIARAFAGAEATVALVILTEEVDAGVRGWTIGLLGAISAVGYGMAALSFTLINVLPYGWRGLYCLALIPLAAIIPLRRTLPESRRFEKSAKSGEHPTNVWQPIAAMFRAQPKRVAMMVAVTFLANMGNPAGVFFPMYLEEARGFSAKSVGFFYIVFGAFGILGQLLIGKLSDHYGRRKMGALCYLLPPLLYLWIYNTSGESIIPAWILALFFDTAAATIFGAYSAELFPTSHRSTAASAMRIAGNIGGALSLFLEGQVYRYTHSHWTAISYLMVFWILAPFVMYFTFPETARRELEEISPEAASSRSSATAQ